MGFLKRLLGIGVTVGATVAAVKVAEQYKENKPNGVQDVNGDGKVDVRDMASEVVKAATEVYHEAESAVRQKAPVVTGKVEDVVNGTAETIKNAVHDSTNP